MLNDVLCWVAPEGVYLTLIAAAVPESSTVPRLAAVIEYVPVPVRVIEKLVPVGLEVTDG
jgi:predicted regulator of amino acid metabolism with ACT domain